MVDVDAHFTHWVGWGISMAARSLAPGQRPPHEALNSFGRRGYGGPCPPPGAAHHYVFRIYALDRDVRPPFGRHVLAVAQLTGLFHRETTSGGVPKIHMSDVLRRWA
jgi:phosphatidylethanolamine-binding protein (PEBP) family uncharacterized protein